MDGIGLMAAAQGDFAVSSVIKITIPGQSDRFVQLGRQQGGTIAAKRTSRKSELSHKRQEVARRATELLH